MSFAFRSFLLMSCSFLPILANTAAAQAASSPVEIKYDLICNEQYAVKITQSSYGLSYYAWELLNWKPEPSLELHNGISYDGHTATHYEFKRGKYTYTVMQTFPARGGIIYLTVDENGKRIYGEPCRSINLDLP